MSEVEYVGHTINKDGIRFSQERIRRALEMPRPKTVKQLASYIGFVEYFRSHIKDMSDLLHPLNQLKSTRGLLRCTSVVRRAR